jgi:hypothetical protein
MNCELRFHCMRQHVPACRKFLCVHGTHTKVRARMCMCTSMCHMCYKMRMQVQTKSYNPPNRTKQQHPQRIAHNKLTRWKPKREMGRPQAPTTSSSSASATSAGGRGKVASGSSGAGGCGSLEVVTEDEEDGGLRSSASVAMTNKMLKRLGAVGLLRGVLDDDDFGICSCSWARAWKEVAHLRHLPVIACVEKEKRGLVWACWCGLGA